MSRDKRISEGKCAVYGTVRHDDYTSMQMWRHRLHNEHAGIARTDQTGTNTTISMLWNPSPRSGGRSAYGMSSHKRPSELKRVQDFGAYNGANARYTLGEDALALSPRVRAAGAPRLPPTEAAIASLVNGSRPTVAFRM